MSKGSLLSSRSRVISETNVFRLNRMPLLFCIGHDNICDFSISPISPVSSDACMTFASGSVQDAMVLHTRNSIHVGTL